MHFTFPFFGKLSWACSLADLLYTTTRNLRWGFSSVSLMRVVVFPVPAKATILVTVPDPGIRGCLTMASCSAVGVDPADFLLVVKPLKFSNVDRPAFLFLVGLGEELSSDASYVQSFS